MRNIIICIDGSSCANFAFRWACENFLRADDHVILLHAAKDFKSLDPSSEKEMNPESIKAYEEKVVEQAKMLTAQYTSASHVDYIKHEAVIIKGDPRVLILEQAEKYHPAAIVMGSRGLGLLKRSIVGSVSDHVIHNCDTPVIVVREIDAPKK